METGPQTRSTSARDKRHQLEVSLVCKRPRLRQCRDAVMTENGEGIDGAAEGDESCSGGCAFPPRLGARKWVDRREFIRLIEQALYGLGYAGVARQLESESGILHEEQHVVDFRGAVTGGNWEAALALLERLNINGEERLKHAKFLVLEQKFLEAAERKDWRVALRHLRTELAPLRVNLARLHELAVCLMCQDLKDLKLVAGWDGIGGNSRRRVLLSLQNIIPADVMVAEDRLLTLLDQALDSQLSKCLYHNCKNAVPSLLSDYSCGKEQIPSLTLQMLMDHNDEVWHVQFSNDGQRLASCSRDGVTIIWEIRSRRHVNKVHELHGHDQHQVLCLAWSPDDQYLATASHDKTVCIWNVNTGRCHRRIDEDGGGHEREVLSVSWLPDSYRFISGGNDLYMCMWNLEGKKLRTWSDCGRVQDLVVSKAGDRLVVLGENHKIRIYDLNGSDVGLIEYLPNPPKVSAIALSNDGSKLLVATQIRQIHLWELEEDLKQPQPNNPAIIYKAPGKNGTQRYIIRTCFGGTDEAFVLSGSEECTVYVWHRRSGELLAELEGHSGTVNSVHWNPVDPYMLASASDDKSVHIWGVSDAVAEGSCRSS